jgi:hypothetical protein
MKTEAHLIVYSMLSALHGREKINSESLARGCGIRHLKSFDRRIREAVEVLRSKTVTVLSDDFGYWISHDPAEIRDWCAQKRREARNEYRTRVSTVRSLERGARRLEVGQPGEQLAIGI